MSKRKYPKQLSVYLDAAYSGTFISIYQFEEKIAANFIKDRKHSSVSKFAFVNNIPCNCQDCLHYFVLKVVDSCRRPWWKQWIHECQTRQQWQFICQIFNKNMSQTGGLGDIHKARTGKMGFMTIPRFVSNVRM